MNPRTALPVIFLVSVVSSCTIPAKIELTNLTGTTIQVVIAETDSAVAEGAALIVAETDIVNAPLRVTFDGARYEYEISRLPLEGIEWRGWGLWSKRVFPVVIDANGHIWVVAKMENIKYEQGGNQPDGYPLMPTAA